MLRGTSDLCEMFEAPLPLYAATPLYIILLAAVFLYRDGPAALAAEVSGATGQKAVIRLEVANTAWKKMKGLMHRESLAADAGMLFGFRFIRRPSFWMKNTLIPLDLIVVAADGTIREIRENLAPRSTDRITPDSDCRYIIEVNGGFCRAHGVVAGDAVILKPAVPK
jgi:uncharacterized membrane protein (UPF0127 family)